MGMQLHPDVAFLVDRVAELEQLLRRNQADHWAGKVAGYLALLRNSDAHGLRKLLDLYGGMGSLNDLVLQASAENDQLDALRSEVWELAQDLS